MLFHIIVAALITKPVHIDGHQFEVFVKSTNSSHAYTYLVYEAGGKGVIRHAQQSPTALRARWQNKPRMTAMQATVKSRNGSRTIELTITDGLGFSDTVWDVITSFGDTRPLQDSWTTLSRNSTHKWRFATGHVLKELTIWIKSDPSGYAGIRTVTLSRLTDEGPQRVFAKYLGQKPRPEVDGQDLQFRLSRNPRDISFSDSIIAPLKR